MKNLDFALSLIRAPWVKRLTDRTFLTTVGTAVAGVGSTVAIWNTGGVPVGDKVNATMAAFVAVSGVVAAWNHGNQKKDAAIAQAALAAPDLTSNLTGG